MAKQRTSTRRRFVQAAAGVAALGALKAPLIAKAEEKFKISIGTLAPQGSAWFDAYLKMGKEIAKATNNEVKFKLYGGGVLGDEKAMVEKMRRGALDGVMATSVGLGVLAPKVLVLQLPLTISSDEQLDKVRDKMSARFESLLADANAHLFGWGDVGFNYWHGVKPVRSIADLKAGKTWNWDTDFVVKAFLEAAGVNAIRAGVPDVRIGLQTGVYEFVLNTPYAAQALQWSEYLPYVLNVKFAPLVGGVVVSKKVWDALPQAHQEVIHKVTASGHKDMLDVIRKNNKKSIEHLVSNGKITPLKPEKFSEWKDAAEKTRKNLIADGTFPQDLVNELLQNL